MKKIFILAILALGIFTFGCEKCEECEECDPDEYYLKYIVATQTAYSGIALDIEVMNEYNESVSYSAENVWNIVLGPVDEDFTASLSVATERTISNTTLIAKIQVSKNDGPFAVKASGENDTSEPLQIDYTIDF